MLAGSALGGCGSQTESTGTLVTTGRASVVPHDISRRIVPLLATLQRDYEKEQIGSISAVVPDVRVAGTIRNNMQRWAEEGVTPLRITLVYARSQSPTRYVGTVKFWSDGRAVPTYMSLVFQRGTLGLRIVGSDSGLRGSSFENMNWTVSRSAHFAVYHSPYLLAGNDRQVLQALEHQRTLFEHRFAVKVAPTVNYYLYPNQTVMAAMSRGGCGTTPEYVGCALPYATPPSIHTIEWPSYHEPIHVYELALEPKPSHGSFNYSPLFISEGLAVALEDQQLDPRQSDYCSDLGYVPLDSCAQQASGQVSPLKLLPDTGFKRGNVGNAYLVGGSFVKYLLLKYGYRRFGSFYFALASQPKDSVQDYDVAAKRIYHVGIRLLLSQWSTALCRSGC